MRNNKRISRLINPTWLVSTLKKHIPLLPRMTTAHYCFALLLFPYISAASNNNLTRVDQALPTLISEGEAMNNTQSWYRAHSKKLSYTSSFNADGSLLALTSQNNPVELWDTTKRQPISLFQGSGLSDSAAFVTLSADSQFIAINVGERIEVRQVNSAHLDFSVPSISRGAATFSPNSRWFVSAIDGKRLDLWDVAHKQRESSFVHHQHLISALGFNQDGKYLVSADVSGILAVWDTNNKELLYQFLENTPPISSIQFSPTGNNFITVDTSGKTLLWDADKRTLLHSFNTPKVVKNSQSSVAFSPDGKTLALSLIQPDGKSYLLLFNTLLGGKPLYTGEHSNVEINNIAYRPDGKSLLVSLNSKTIKVFHIPSKQYVDAFGGQILKANSTRVSPDGKVFATGTVDGYIQLWDADKKTLKYSLKGRNRSIEHVSFSPDEQYIISGDNQGAITLWKRSSNSAVLSLNAHKHGAAHAAISPDSQYLATASTKSSIIKLWDIETKQTIFRFIGHHGDITGLAYSPNGKFIASSSKDGTIKLWNTANNSLERSFIGNRKTVGFSSLVFSPDGRYLAGGTNQGPSEKHVIEIWDVQELKHVRTLSMHPAAITAVRFSHNGQQLVSGAIDGAIKVWNIETGASTHTFTGKDTNSPIQSVDFTKDGKSILSVTHDGATDLWSLEKNTKSYTLLGGPRGTWVSLNHIKQRFIRGDDGSLNIKTSTITGTSNNTPPAPLAPLGLATEDNLILTAARESVKVTDKGAQFNITVSNIGEKSSFWLRAKQLNNNRSPVTLLSSKLTRLDAGKRGILNLKLIPNSTTLRGNANTFNLEMEVITNTGSHFPIVIPLEFQFPATHITTGRNKG